MSRLYTPDRWTVIYYPEQDVHTILAGWGGGYLHGPSWRRSTEVQRAEEQGEFYFFYNYSGSVYKCLKDSYGFTATSASVYENMDDAEALDENEFVEFYKQLQGEKRG